MAGFLALRGFYARWGRGVKPPVIAESTIVASGVASSPIRATHDGETIHVTYQNGSGAMGEATKLRLTVSSTDGGVTFA